MIMPIRPEGGLYIIIVLVIATLLSIASIFYPSLTLRITAVLLWIVVILVVNFFRDPQRETPVDECNIIAPADGKIIDIRKVMEESYLKKEVIRVSIFMSIFDVHVNRAPVAGVIDYMHYNPGEYFPAYREKASLDNEQMSIGFKKDTDKKEETKIMIKLIAGLVARRIIVWKNLKDTVNQGERISMIKFGSRVEVYLSSDSKLLVGVGDKVKAGETIIAKIRE
jgi:phosphatidylserine decarboxylase